MLHSMYAVFRVCYVLCILYHVRYSWIPNVQDGIATAGETRIRLVLF